MHGPRHSHTRRVESCLDNLLASSAVLAITDRQESAIKTMPAHGYYIPEEEGLEPAGIGEILMHRECSVFEIIAAKPRLIATAVQTVGKQRIQRFRHGAVYKLDRLSSLFINASVCRICVHE